MSLIGKWIECQLPLGELPFHFFECPDIAEFMARYVGVVLPRLFLAKDTAGMEVRPLFMFSSRAPPSLNHQVVARLLKRDLKDLILEHFSSVLANSFPLYLFIPMLQMNLLLGALDETATL